METDRNPTGSHLKEQVFTRDDFPVRAACRVGTNPATVQPASHPEIEFRLICQGQGQYFIRDRCYEFQGNSVLIMHRNEIHNYVPVRDSSIKSFFLVFSEKLLKGSETSSSILHNLDSHHHITLREKDATAAEFLLQEVSAECASQGQYWREMVLHNVEKFLIMLDRARVTVPSASPTDNPLVQEVIAHLEHCFAEKSLLAEVADRFCLSPSSLSRAFKAYAGIGFKEYLIHRRIVEAKRLLEETNLKVASISQMVGFDDLSTFNRDFKMLTGLSPSAYRKISL